MLVVFAVVVASAAEDGAECRALLAGADSVPLYRDPTAERPTARISVHAELVVVPTSAPRWRVAIDGRERWVDAGALAPPGSCVAPPVEVPAAVEDPAFDAAVTAFLRRHPVPGAGPWLLYVPPADEADVAGSLVGRRGRARWRTVRADELPAPLDPGVVAEVRAHRAMCAVGVARTEGGWELSPLAGWCYRAPAAPR
jgi:hypothetical protein